MSRDDVREWLRNHTRATGALMTLLLVLTQVQAVLASGTSGGGGP